MVLGDGGVRDLETVSALLPFSRVLCSGVRKESYERLRGFPHGEEGSFFIGVHVSEVGRGPRLVVRLE